MTLDDDLQKNQRFLKEVEQVIRLANKEVIHKQVPSINTDRMVSFAIAVAKLRAQYIQAAFSVAEKNSQGEAGDEADISELRKCREAFTEARDAFIVLQRAIEIGYVSVE